MVRDLRNRTESIGAKGVESETLDQSRDVGSKGGRGSDQSDSENDVRVDARVENGRLDVAEVDRAGRIRLSLVVVDDASLEDVSLSLVEEVPAREEEWRGLAGRAGEKEDEDER